VQVKRKLNAALKKADLTTITAKGVRRMLEEEMGLEKKALDVMKEVGGANHAPCH
jgi:hypothetical protein